jgi:hypothetical protein
MCPLKMTFFVSYSVARQALRRKQFQVVSGPPHNNVSSVIKRPVQYVEIFSKTLMFHINFTGRVSSAVTGVNLLSGQP